MLVKVHVYMCLHIASIKSTAGNKTKFFLYPLLISTSRFLICAKAFRNDYVAACSIALRSATEKNELDGNVTVPCPSKVKHCSSTADWLKFYWRHKISYDGTHTEQIFTFKVTLCNNSCNRCCKLVDTVYLDLICCTSQLKKVDFYTNQLN